MSIHQRKHRNHDTSDEDAWLITYADMVTLLLCFFIIMFALSSPNSNKMAKAVEAMQNFNVKTAGVAEKATEQDTFTALKNELQLSLGKSGYGEMASVSKNDKFVSMELASDSFFDAGSATFSSSAEGVLQLAATQIVPLANKKIRIEVEGYTDDSPIATAKFPSNWELSCARAASVVRYMISQGFPPDKISAVGYAETHAKAPNEDTEGKPIIVNQALNRRVVIKLLTAEETDQ